jgi:hypothetical protein
MIELVPLKLTDDKLAEIANYLLDKLQQSVDARINQVDSKYKRWQDNYAARPMTESRTTPFPGASNFVPQLIRMHTDILSARLCGIVFATKPFWKPKTWLKDLPHEAMDALSQWLEYVSFGELDIFEPIDFAIFQAAKTGTSVLKAPWVDQTFASMNAQGGAVMNEFEGVKLYPIPFDDFYPWPIVARNLCDTRIKFHQLRFLKEDIEWRMSTAQWDEAAAKGLLQTPNPENSEPKRETEAMEAGITLTSDVSRPFNVIEAWFDYSLDGRTMYKLIFTLNPKRRGKEAVLRAVYNYYARGEDPFIDIRLMPRDDLFYGYSVPEVLEQSQEEQAQIHNSRRDSNTIANTPGWKKKMYANVPNPAAEWYPGKVFDVEAMDDLDILQFGGNYNSMMEEESFLLQLAERYTGIQAPMQGYGAGVLEGKRGVYNTQGTLALLAEGNKRLDIFLRRLRLPFSRFGNLLFQSYKEFRPNGPELEAFGKASDFLKQVFQIKEPHQYRGLFFDIGASDSGTNRELDRQNLLLMANTMAAYYRQVVEASVTLSQLPENHPLQNILLSTLDGAKDLADRLLFVFDIGDRQRLLPDVRAVLEGGPGRGGAAQPPGMPEPEEAVGVGQLQDISTRLAAFSGRGSA